MISLKKINIYKITVSFAFGLLGFFCNFHTIIFPFGDYTVAVLFGLLFPLLISLSWGWKYGLLSALAGGCQTVWWLWGPSNGYAIFLVAPPFTFWVVWHGIFAGLRSKTKDPQWWLNLYILEIPFRILCSINLLVFSRWAITLNPPPWNWAAGSINTIPINFSIFVAIKQACVGFVILLSADMLLNISYVRAFFKLKPVVDQRRTGYIVSIFLLIGCLFWLLDSFFHGFASNGGRSFVAYFALDIPSSNLFTRIVFLIFCMACGMVTSRILRKQKQGEMTLRKAKEDAVTREVFLKTLIQTIPDLVWLKNPQGTYLSCNSRFERYFGAKEAEIVGKTDYDFVDTKVGDAFKENDKKAIATGEAITYEEDIIFADDGHREHLETIKTPMYNTSGELIGVLGIGRDITERLNLLTQLVHAQKMEAVGRLAGGVAHDYNNMTSVIMGYTEMALDRIASDDPLYADLQEIMDAAKRSKELTRQLLAFARRQSIAPKVLDINDTVQSMLKMLHPLIGEDIELVWSPGGKVWPIQIDPSQIDQILANLCVNARDAISGVGKIIIETANAEIDEAYCSLHQGFVSGEFVRLMVSDDGAGMDSTILDKIFEPFFSTKAIGRGTGLGLATVYGIVKQNNGFINVYSEPGHGAAFSIYLPRVTGPSVDVPCKSSAETLPVNNETVFLVEDEAAILKLSERMLKKLGYRVLATKSPLEAIAMARRHPEPIDLLITDVIMPELNGRDLARRLQDIFPGLKVLFMSGYTSNVIVSRGVLDKDVFLLQKPFSINEFATKIREVLTTETDPTE